MNFFKRSIPVPETVPIGGTYVQCDICHEPLFGNAFISRCGHIYHSKCKREWAISDICILCNQLTQKTFYPYIDENTFNPHIDENTDTFNQPLESEPSSSKSPSSNKANLSKSIKIDRKPLEEASIEICYKCSEFTTSKNTTYYSGGYRIFCNQCINGLTISKCIDPNAPSERKSRLHKYLTLPEYE